MAMGACGERPSASDQRERQARREREPATSDLRPDFTRQAECAVGPAGTASLGRLGTGMMMQKGAYVRAGQAEAAIALGDGTFVGFPTPCGDGRGCGNPLCTMNCIRRVTRAELLHWAGQHARELVVEGQAAPEHGGAQEAALRAVHLLGRSGGELFFDRPSALAEWCLADCDTKEGCGLDWDAESRLEAAVDLWWFNQQPRPKSEELEPEPEEQAHLFSAAQLMCPICAAAPRSAAKVDGVVYESHLLLRWLSTSEVDLHPGSGRPMNHSQAVRHALWRGYGDACYSGRARSVALQSAFEAAKRRRPAFLWLLLGTLLPGLLLLGFWLAF